MATTAKTKRKRATPRELLARDEIAAQRLRAKLESAQIKAALSYYAAADTGRRNKDWKAPAMSADQAIIPDAPITNARARHAIANTWVGKAAKRAQVRNVAGRGIEVVPAPKGADGKELPTQGDAIAFAWSKWATAFRDCDVEQKRTFYQIQRTMVGEEFATGISLLVWSYEPNPYNVGLRLQLFEYEQLDTSIRSHLGNEVIGGVEVDENGAALAYHFFKRNPNDYIRPTAKPIRVLADRVFPLFDAERVRQTTAISHLAPVLQSGRNFDRFTDSTLFRAYFESCIGMVITKNNPTAPGGVLGLPRGPGDTGQTSSGANTFNFAPGMVPELQPGESVTPFVPSTPGDQYGPFTEVTLRGFGAGVGMSYGALTRKNDGNYSAARQDMLEDEREIGPQQDALVDHIVKPTYELFVALAILEQRVPISEADYAANRDSYSDADYIVPARPWIDPEKEFNAYEKGIKNRLTTRSAIWAQQGGRYAAGLKQIARERDQAAAVKILLPEEVDMTSPQKLLPAPVDPNAPEDANADQTANDGTASLRKLTVIADVPPNYRTAISPDIGCASCRYNAAGLCTAYSDTEVGDAFVCDSYEVPIVTERTGRIPPNCPPEDYAGVDRNLKRDIV